MDTCSKWWISHKYPLVSVKGRTVSGFLEVSTGSQMVQLPCSSTLAGSPSSLVTGWWSNTRFGGWGAVSEAQSGQKKVRHRLFNLFWRKPKTYEYTLTYKKNKWHIGRLCLFVCEPVYLRVFAVQPVVMVLCLSVNVLLFPFIVLSLWADQQAYSSSLLKPRGSLC